MYPLLVLWNRTMQPYNLPDNRKGGGGGGGGEGGGDLLIISDQHTQLHGPTLNLLCVLLSFRRSSTTLSSNTDNSDEAEDNFNVVLRYGNTIIINI